MLTGGELERDALFWHYPHNRPDVKYYMGSAILFDGEWKLYEGHSVIPDALFNIKEDPMERENVLLGNPELAQQLRKRLHRWMAQVHAKMPPPLN